MEIIENFVELVDISSITEIKEYVNMVDISISDDESFSLSNGIISHNSASGSILQKRNPKTDGVYSLKGKVKNVRSISDLASNKEIIELMQILDLDTDPSKRTFSYKRIIVATDADCDGYHIFSLLVNFFFRWFPYVIEEGRLFFLKIPLMSTEDAKGRIYFYDKKEFDDHVNKKKPIKNIRYLKGLGSLDVKDWGVIMADMQLLLIEKGPNAKQWVDMAFGTDSHQRKLWLQNKFEKDI